MKSIFWVTAALLSLFIVLVSCASPQPSVEPATIPEVESEPEIEAGEAPEQLEVVEEMVEAEEEVVVEAQADELSASEVAEMERAAAEAIRAEERAPTFRGNNEQDTAEDVDPDAPKSLADYLPVLGPAPEVINGEPWINSDPLTLEQLKGKVVLIEFWTYS